MAKSEDPSGGHDGEQRKQRGLRRIGDVFASSQVLDTGARFLNASEKKVERGLKGRKGNGEFRACSVAAQCFYGKYKAGYNHMKVLGHIEAE